MVGGIFVSTVTIIVMVGSCFYPTMEIISTVESSPTVPLRGIVEAKIAVNCSPEGNG